MFDFGNAFKKLGEVSDVCPELLYLLQQGYKLFSSLYNVDETLLPKKRFQQGDVLVFV